MLVIGFQYPFVVVTGRIFNGLTINTNVPFGCDGKISFVSPRTQEIDGLFLCCFPVTAPPSGMNSHNGKSLFTQHFFHRGCSAISEMMARADLCLAELN